MSNVKVYKNPQRKIPETHQPYIPQYKQHGVKPQQYNSPIPKDNTESLKIAKPSVVNPRSPRPFMQPYAESVPSPIGREKGRIPNVGNNMEQTWATMDGNIEDDIDLDATMIDNNEFVSDQALGLQPQTNKYVKKTDQLTQPSNMLTQNSSESFGVNFANDILNITKQLEENEYLLIVNGESICSGPLSFVEGETKLLIYGEHERFLNNPVSVEEIVILKKVKIKVGIFLE